MYQSEQSVLIWNLQKMMVGLKKSLYKVSGQGWKRHKYIPQIPPKVLKEIQRLEQEGTETDSAPYDESTESDAKGTESHAEDTESDDKKALKEVQSNSSYNSSSNASGNSSLCSEQCFDSEPEIILSIPLIHKNKNRGGSELFPIRQSDIDGWSESFPAVDVLQELKKLREWNLSNPKKRKTRNGIRRHITTWLSKAQDKGVSGTGGDLHNKIVDVGQRWLSKTE